MSTRAGLIATAALALAASITLAADRPNLIIMMTDDQRADAMSCAGNTILHTPGMDRLASEGIRFRNMFVTNSLCAPSRATLLTGQYSHTHGVIDNKGRQIRDDQKLLPDYLREAGYEVAFCGKSHVKGALRDRQWDYYFGYQGQGRYIDPIIAEGTGGEDKTYGGYMDDVVTGRAIEFLTFRRNKDKPFCLFLWFKAPHRSWVRARRHLDLYNGVKIPKPETFDHDLYGYPGKPNAFAEADNKIGKHHDVRTLEEFAKNYYAVLKAVDENVGYVLHTLDDQNLTDNTAVFYTSDNGFFLGEWRAYDKRLMHEPSIRVPMLVRYPGMVDPGSLSDKMILNVDIAPTVLDLAGVEVPELMHGRSFAPLLRGEDVEWRKDWLYEYYEFPAVHSVRKNRGVRTDRYKYIHYFEEPQEYELYDLQEDPGELNNLYGKPEYDDLVEELRQRLKELRKETGDV